MIIKIQKPLCSSGNPEALIYDKSRRIMVQMEYNEALAVLFKDGESKVYHDAAFDLHNRLHIGARVEDQNW